MNNNIKEMIDKIKKCLIAGYDIDIISQEEMGILWNYITNLQEKYNGIKSNFDIQLEYDEELENKITNLQEKYERMKENAKILSNGYNDLEKRNEKAIEYMNNTFNITSIKEFYEHLDNIENILQGEDKDVKD